MVESCVHVVQPPHHVRAVRRVQASLRVGAHAEDVNHRRPRLQQLPFRVRSTPQLPGQDFQLSWHSCEHVQISIYLREWSRNEKR